MKFQLARTLEGIKMYGTIYDLGSGVPDKVEEYIADDIDDWFLDNMIEKINYTCETLLDDGDFDYIDAERCKDLIEMIDNLSSDFIPEDFQQIFYVLKDYAKRAIEYNTGIEIEM